MSTKSVTPLRLPFDATLTVPCSKSKVNRVLVLAALSNESTVLKDVTAFDDVEHMVNGLCELGFSVQWNEDKTEILVNGVTSSGDERRTSSIFCGNSGTTVRFLTALACLIPGEWTITGDEHMQKRPIQPLIDALTALGAKIECETGCPPLIVKGGTIKGGTVELDASKSSQYLTALLLIGHALPQGLTINLPEKSTSQSYVDLSLECMKDFGIDTDTSDTTYSLHHQQCSGPKEYSIEGDWSAAASCIALAELTGSRCQFSNLKKDSIQGDSNLPQAIASFRGDGDRCIDCEGFPDQLMTLAVIAARRNGKTTLKGAANLRHKECDRLAVISRELQKTGIDIQETEDGVVVQGSKNLKPAVLDPENDHRMAFAFGVLGSLFDGIEVQNAECVAKTYANFWDHLSSLQDSPRCIALIGMRGVGKTSVAKKLAKLLGLNHIDIDQLFEKQHGPIREHVEKHGWEEFRKQEELLTAEHLKPGNVVSLGGGAIESKVTQQNLRTESITVWIDETEKVIVERLQNEKRPALTNMTLEEEVRSVLRDRNPIYQSLADIRVAPKIPVYKAAQFIVSTLQDQCSW